MQKATRFDELEDLVGTLGQTFLGLTINCARCHDHKFDPISQKEYYQVAALLGGVNQEEKERSKIALAATRRPARLRRRRARDHPAAAAAVCRPGARRLPEARRGRLSRGAEGPLGAAGRLRPGAGCPRGPAARGPGALADRPAQPLDGARLRRTGSGTTTSARGSSRPRAISASTAAGPAIRSCSTTSRRGSWRAAGRSRTCTA